MFATEENSEESIKTTQKNKLDTFCLPQPRYFVTGTDTDIGKTVSSAVLAQGLKAHYWKPIQSGRDPRTDSDFMRQILGDARVHPEAYCLQEPLSPHLSARLEGTEIDLERILLQMPQTAPLIVEGAGGVMVPINKSQFVIDLIYHLRLPTLVVARTRLGTINHTLLTLQALRTRRIEVAGVIMVGEENGENRRAIEHYGQIAVLGRIPLLADFSQAQLLAAFSQLALGQDQKRKEFLSHE